LRFARRIVLAISGAANFPKPEGCPRFRKVMRVALSLSDSRAKDKRTVILGGVTLGGASRLALEAHLNARAKLGTARAKLANGPGGLKAGGMPAGSAARGHTFAPGAEWASLSPDLGPATGWLRAKRQLELRDRHRGHGSRRRARGEAMFGEQTRDSVLFGGNLEPAHRPAAAAARVDVRTKNPL
jgi:hypothetical protein